MKKLKKFLWVCINLLVVISIGLVLRRLLIILDVLPDATSSRPVAGESVLKQHAWLTLAHIIPGLVFVLLAPWLLKNVDRLQTDGRYRSIMYSFTGVAYIIGISAISMTLVRMPVGGLAEACAAVLFGTIFLNATTQLVINTRKKNYTVCRDWLLRTVVIGLAIASTRPVMVIALVVGKLSLEQFLGTAFWIAFTIHLWIVESWIYCRSTAGKMQVNEQ